MDNGIYNIIYFDTRARANRVVKTTDREELHPGAATELKYEGLGGLHLEEEVESNIELLLSVFSEGTCYQFSLMEAGIVVRGA